MAPPCEWLNNVILHIVVLLLFNISSQCCLWPGISMIGQLQDSASGQIHRAIALHPAAHVTTYGHDGSTQPRASDTAGLGGSKCTPYPAGSLKVTHSLPCAHTYRLVLLRYTTDSNERVHRLCRDFTQKTFGSSNRPPNDFWRPANKINGTQTLITLPECSLANGYPGAQIPVDRPMQHSLKADN